MQKHREETVAHLTSECSKLAQLKRNKRYDKLAVEKDNKAARLTDMALTGDARVEEKQQEKADKYQKLTRELKRLWKVNTNVIPIVVSVLGTTPKTWR